MSSVTVLQSVGHMLQSILNCFSCNPVKRDILYVFYGEYPWADSDYTLRATSLHNRKIITKPSIPCLCILISYGCPNHTRTQKLRFVAKVFI